MMLFFFDFPDFLLESSFLIFEFAELPHDLRIFLFDLLVVGHGGIQFIHDWKIFFRVSFIVTPDVVDLFL